MKRQQISERLDGNHRAGDGFARAGRSKEKFEAFPGATTQSTQQFAIIQEIAPQKLGQGKDHMPMRDLFQDRGPEKFPELHDPFGMAGWTEVAPLAGKSHQEFFIAFTTSDASETLLQIAAIKELENDFLDVRSPETIFVAKSFVITPGEFVKMILDAAIPGGRLGIALAIDS